MLISGPYDTPWIATTPTPTSAVGTFTAVSATLRYKNFGRMIAFNGSVTVTTIGTASGSIRVPLPVSNSNVATAKAIIADATLTPIGAAANVSVAGQLSITITAGVTTGAVVYFAGEYEV